jgi:hypothetical protein
MSSIANSVLLFAPVTNEQQSAQLPSWHGAIV